MKKILIDADLDEKEWFMDMTKDEKLLYKYIVTHADSIGVFEINRIMLEFKIGIKINLPEFIEKCNGNIVILKGIRLWIPDYVSFQYGKIEVKSNNYKLQGIAKKLYVLANDYDVVNKYVIKHYAGFFNIVEK